MKKIKLTDILVNIILAFLFALSITWNSYQDFELIPFIIFMFFSYIFFSFIWQKIDCLTINKTPDKILKREFIIYGLLILTVLVSIIIAYYPGYVFADSYNQYNQVQTGIYNNWHPVLLTLFLFRLPTLIYNQVISITIFQNLIIFGILLYFCYFLRKNFLSFKHTLVVLLLIILNPLIMKYNIFLLKDILYSWFMFLTTLFLINIVISDGKWLQKNTNRICLIISSLPILCFRHNGIVPFILMYLVLIIYYPSIRKFCSITLIGILSMFFLVTGPIYKYFNVDNKTGGKSEMIGLIMGQISYYYHNGVITNKEYLSYLEDIGPLNIWNENYLPNSFNNIKWKLPDYIEKVNYNFNEILKMWLELSIKHPQLFIKSYLNITAPIWNTTQNVYNVYDYDYHLETIISPKGKMKETSEKFLDFFKSNFTNLNKSFFRWFFINIGEALFLIIFCVFIVLKKYKGNLQKLIPFIVVLSNSLIIMLLITGGEERFIFSQVLCVYPLIIYSLANFNKKEKLKLEKNND